MICDKCHQDKPDVSICIDPYYEEILKEEIETALCDDCYQASCEDI